MRLHRLVICGVGPFARQVDIDFARLGGNGIFLLEGPTGSGKSTVIDAISFALYGKLAQSGGDAERLRSHFADADTESFVDLTWETQTGVYRIRRTPRYTRPKRRGDGLRVINPTVKLWRLGQLDTLGGGQSLDPTISAELLSTRIDEVADEITRAIGLSHAQFVQTVVLPQGEFANFLRASSDDKRALLQKLFGTQLLATVQAHLVEQRQQAEHRRSSSVQALSRAVHAFTGAASLILDHTDGESDPDPTPAAGGPALPTATDAQVARLETALLKADTAELIELTGQAVLGLAGLEQSAAHALAVAEHDRGVAQSRLKAAEDILVRHTRREKLRQRLQILEAGRAAEQVMVDELSAAERATAVTGVAQAHQQALSRQQRVTAAAEIRRSRLPIQWRDQDELTLKSVADQLRWSRGSLDEHAKRETQLLVLRVRSRQLSADIGSTGDDLTNTHTALGRLGDELVDLIEPREKAAAAWATVDSLEREHLQASEVLTAATAARRMRDELAHGEAAVTDALRAERLAAQEALQWRRRRLDSIAGELGLALSPGEPCLVCGSLVHPAPAQPGSDHVSEEQVRLSEVQVGELADVRAKAVGELNRVNSRFTELQALAGGRAILTAETELETLHHRLDSAVRAGAEMSAFDKRRAALLARQDELEQGRRVSFGRLEVLADQLTRCDTDIAESERILAAARAGFATVSERLIDIDGQLIVLDDAAAHVASESAAVTSLRHTRADLDKALAEAGFLSEQAYRAAHRDIPALTALRGELLLINAEWTQVRTALAAVELLDDTLDAKPAAQLAAEVNEADASVIAAEACYSELSARFGAARDRLAEAQAHAERVSLAARESEAVLQSTAAAIRLGYLVAGLGDNQLRMDLSTFVLVRRFEDIVAAANSQLRRVSNGRYELQHSDARQGNARSGLGLRVMDLRTDQSRDPATLSGGETFYVSLSLALGLADVVRAESGGLDLGTLFIDEGFGSLDSETLDDVVSVLEGLRAGGRAVGVVSHVAELKARITDRIEIRANQDGSSRLSVLA